VCEEESYLLELTRYIHLNPLRSGIVENVKALDSYPWCGHAVLLGGRAFAGQDTAAVLSRFGNDLKTARLSYRSFERDGVRQGHRDEFSGGGMRRSAKAQDTEPGAEAFDERVLGSGAFVEHLLEFHDMPERQKQPVLSLKKLIDAVCATYGIAVGSLGSADKNPAVASARAVTCYLAVRQLGYKGTEVARTLHITPSCVAVSLKRGDALLKQDAKAQEVLANIKISTTSPSLSPQSPSYEVTPIAVVSGPRAHPPNSQMRKVSTVPSGLRRQGLKSKVFRIASSHGNLRLEYRVVCTM